MNNLEKKQLGYLGETLAKNFLEKKGYACLAQNYTIPGGEIDLIMQDGETLVFVEVKTKQTNTLTENVEEMFERVTPQKIKFLQRSLEMYCLKKGYSVYDTDMRVDLVYVLYKDSSHCMIEHIPNGIYFDD